MDTPLQRFILERFDFLSNFDYWVFVWAILVLIYLYTSAYFRKGG